MIYLILYVFLYCNADDILNKLYLSNYSTTLNNELIQNNSNIYYSITNLNLFVLTFYSIYFISKFVSHKSINTYSSGLAFVYIKYTLNILFKVNMTLSQHEFSRNVMWLFATPLMLKMYCDINNIKLRDINIQCHIIPVVINVFIYPHDNKTIFVFLKGSSWALILFFMKTLYEKRNLMFTNIYLCIWSIFALLNTIELFQLTDIYTINLYYLFTDVISKLTVCIMIDDCIARDKAEMIDIDLQSVQFISYMITHINKYKIENNVITPACNTLIDYAKIRFLAKIPEDKTILEKELLNKILPFGFDKEYISSASATASASASARQFNMICVLFTDIVNYTELAQKYDDTIIFQLLNNLYISFDKIIKKYSHLQKIETIGDAYMVVGDIFRNTINHNFVINEILSFAIDIIKEVKTIKTPDNIPLCIRIGINIGSVSIGILGNELPRLCVVGNAVNMASRLQSTAEIDTIQISSDVYELLQTVEIDKKYEFVIKENVFLKNMGSVTTYNIPPPNCSSGQ
uniref:Guanylate cyclase domain-containing protein n=1 Tax=viral metagenome TaxID=1070528 RepID=A0A6C0JKS6_9ZZZZ